MKLNNDKREAATEQNENIKFNDTTTIQRKQEVQYLGCMINQKANIEQTKHKDNRRIHNMEEARRILEAQQLQH